MSLKRPIAALLAFRTVSLFVICAFFLPAAAAVVGAAEPAAHSLSLEYRETAEALLTRAVRAELTSIAFKKEPVLPPKDVLRGLLRWGAVSEQPIPFVWSRSESKLYLDLNRNQDFTDDPKGVFFGGTNLVNQVFTNVPLPRVTAAGTHPVLVRLEFRSSGANSIGVTAGLGSYWQAKATLGGKDWQFGIVENVLVAHDTISPQYLLWRPWSERELPFYLSTSSADFAQYSTNLFLAGQTYTLGCRYEAQSAPPQYQAVLTERFAALGELKLTGSSIHRLFLIEEKGLLAILDDPEGTVRIPVGNYSVPEIWLRSQDIEVAGFDARRVKVRAGETANLKAGAPLTNSVAVQSSGYNLVLTYKLLGVDGTEYHFPRRQNERPPEFAIFDGTNRLATGKFAYG